MQYTNPQMHPWDRSQDVVAGANKQSNCSTDGGGGSTSGAYEVDE